MKKLLIKIAYAILRNQQIESLQYFYKEVGKIASRHDEDYYSAKVEIVDNKIVFTSYINNYSHYAGNSVESSLKKLLNRVEPEDVENPTDIVYVKNI